MTDTEADETGGGSSSATPSDKAKHGDKAKPERRKRKGGLIRFLREVVAEMRKVVYPTRQELVTYTSVVIVFVLIVMLFVSVLDFGIAKLMSWAFAG